MMTRLDKIEPYQVESPKAGWVKKRIGVGAILAETTSGNDETSSNRDSSRRLISEKDDQNCSVENSAFNQKKKKNKKKRKKRTINIGTWNIRTLLALGKLQLLLRELDSHDMNITGIAEHRWEGSGHFTCDDHLIIYSGAEKQGQGGVAVILDNEAKKGFISYNAISDRILVVHLDTKPVQTSIIQVYAPTSTHTDEEIEEFYSQLQTVQDSINNNNPTIIMGDFNAKVGQGASKHQGLGPHGLGLRNESGEKLLTFSQANHLCILNTWFQHHPRRLFTWTSNDRQKTKNQIDYILVSKSWFTSFIDCKTRPGADGDTDHNLLTAKMKMKGFKKKSSNSSPKRYDLQKLQDPETKNSFQLETNNRFQVLLEHVEEKMPEALWDDIKKVFNETANKVLGVKKTKKAKPWISESTIQMADAKRKARKEQNDVEYKKLKKDIKTKIKEDKETWLSTECSKIDSFDKCHKSKEMFEKIRKVKSKEFKVSQCSINNKDGMTLTDPEAILSRWKEYGKQLFGSPTQVTTEPLNVEDKEPPPLISEIEDAMKKLNDGKAPGLDNIPAELLKSSGENATKAIHTLCCKIWNTCQWPSEWKEQEMVMLHKAGSAKECGNYRTIALISHTSKILLHIILNRLKLKIEFELAEEQAGFRAGRGTGDMLCAIQVLLEKINGLKERDSYIIFIDYSKAFDSVDHHELIQTLSQMGFPLHLIALIQSLYTDQSAKIRWNSDHSEPFSIEKGVRQGCILSPHLFSAYTEQIMRDSNMDEFGIKINGRKISNLRYADDTALCANNHEEATALINSLNDAGVKKSLKLNVKKTKTVYIGEDENYSPIKIGEEEIDRVKQFKYLGSIKTEDAYCSTDIRARIGMAKQRMTELNNIWRDENININLKLRLLRCLVWTVMVYGSEGWTLRKQDETRLESAEMWMYRRLLRVKWQDKRTNDSILKELNVQRQILNEVKKRKMTYFGHTCRNKKCTLMKECIQGSLEGLRKRGRPRTSYLENIKAWTNINKAADIYNTVERRQDWRDEVRKATRAANAKGQMGNQAAPGDAD